MVSLRGFNEQVATFEVDDTVKPGYPVKLTANCKVTACAAGDTPIGVAVNVRGGYAGVQVKGYVRVPYTGLLSLGVADISGDPGGKVKPAAETGLTVIITDIDSGSSTVGFIM